MFDENASFLQTLKFCSIKRIIDAEVLQARLILLTWSVLMRVTLLIMLTLELLKLFSCSKFMEEFFRNVECDFQMWQSQSSYLILNLQG